MKTRKAIALTAALASLPTTMSAQELDPRSYINLPIGQNFFGVGYGYADGDFHLAPDVPVDDSTLVVDGPVLAYAHTFSMFGNASKIDIVGGYSCVEAEATFQGEAISRDWCGINDVKVRLNYNFYGAKAVELVDFVKQPKGVVIGASVQLNIPAGDYDDRFLLNIGSNRWFVKPEIGASIPFGKWEFDLAVSAKIFGDNDELLGDQLLAQDPIYNIQSHLIYDIGPRQWIALNANYFFGGDTRVGGEKTSKKTGNYRAGLTYSYAIDSQNSFKLLANTGVTTVRGNDTKVFSIAYAYRW